MNEKLVSISPSGDEYSLPAESDYKSEFDRISLFCRRKADERNCVDLKKVIEAIKILPTHNNMIFPGSGVGGYCLPKDGGLGAWV